MSKVLELVEQIEYCNSDARCLTLTKIIRLQHQALKLVASSKDLRLTESKDYIFMTIEETNRIAGSKL